MIVHTKGTNHMHFKNFAVFCKNLFFLRYFALKSVFKDNKHDLVTLVYVVSYYKNNQYLHINGTKNVHFKKKLPEISVKKRIIFLAAINISF